MGTDPARITAADFVTPPEYRGLSLSASEAGRVGGLRLELMARDGTTGLGACYQQVPLRVLPPFHFPGKRPVLLYVLNPTAGLLDGDGHLVELTARGGATALVAGQSATRVHPCPKGFAAQRWVIRIESGATVVVLPGPTIPFEGCRYYQRVEADLEPGANFVWGDVGLAGRYARGAMSERFRFAGLVQEFQVLRGGRVAFRDRFCWRGPWQAPEAAWHFGNGTAWGSVFATGPVAPDREADGEPAAAWLTTASGDTCVRRVGPAERVTACTVRTALAIAGRLTSAAPEESWAVGNELAPVHWFSGSPS